MKNHRIIRAVLAVLLCVAMILPFVPLEAKAAALDNVNTRKDFEGLRLSVIGDSITTYYGVSNAKSYNPLYLTTSEATFGTYYGNTSHGDYAEFSQVKWTDTWWKQVADTLGMDLLVNNAWSGSFVLTDQGQGNTTEYGAAAYKDRCVNLHYGSTKPDMIAVFLGTNDVAYYGSQDVGTKADIDTASERNALYKSVNNFTTPTSSVEAYYIMISRMIATYGDAEIYCMLPTISLNTMSSGRAAALADFNAGVKYIVEYFAAQGKKIYLVDLGNDSGLVQNSTVLDYYYANNVHPDIAGMDWITACVVSEIIENSTKGRGNSTYHSVSYNLTNCFSATGRHRYTAEGEPFYVDLLPYTSGAELDITATMKDAATGETIDVPTAGNRVYISDVKGPITIQAKAGSKITAASDNFYWKAESTGFNSKYGPGWKFNDTALASGTHSNGVMSSAQYTLGESVVLRYDQPWVLEYKGGDGTYAGGILLLSDTVDSPTSGNTYVHITQTNVFFGYRDSVGYNNSGIQWATIASKMGSSAGADYRKENHVFRFVNEPNGTNNKIRLYVDGVDVGTMDQSKMIGGSATHESVGNINLSGKNFVFNYIGSTSHPINNCTINYIKVWEQGIEAQDSDSSNFYWETSDGQFVSKEEGQFESNGTALYSGTISGNTFDNVTMGLEKPIVLKHDEQWRVKWKSQGTWNDPSNGAMLLAGSLNYKGLFSPYLYRRDNSNLIGFGEWDGSQHNNYGVRLEEYGIDGTKDITLELVNELTYGTDGKTVADNMVYLYVDGVKIAPLNTHYVGGATTGTASDWIKGKDFVFHYMGTTKFPVSDCSIEYLQVTVDHEHTYGSWTTVQPTCTEDGYERRSCTICGLVDEIILDATGHSYSQVEHPATCKDYAYVESICGACGYSELNYETTQWQETVPDVDPSRIQSVTEYRYSDYESLTSYEPNLAGYSVASTQWVRDMSQNLYYVKSWPSGFDKTNLIYSQYNNSKVTAGETDTTKITVESDKLVGYLYYHWCYSKSVNSMPSKTGSYTIFHAYYSPTAPSNYKYDANDDSYGTYHIGCSNSNWYWPIEVYAQSYTEYDKLYTYERWTDWSEWSNEAVTATATRKVESRTLYRAILGDLGDHSFDGDSCGICGLSCIHENHDVNGACVKCGTVVGHSYSGVVTDPTCTTEGYTTYTCDACGHSYIADKVAASNHNYQGVVTAPDCENDGFTTYTCTACGDSYVSDYVDAQGHSYESVVTKATCTSDGYTTHTCTVCKESYVTDQIAAKGHSYDAKVTAPTCTVDGYTTYTCSVCGSSYVDDVVTAPGHSYSMKYTAPGCTVAGSMDYTCSACGDTYSEEILPTGHNYVDGTCTNCGAADPDAPSVIVPTLNLDHPSLSFEGEIMYNLYFTADDLTSVEEMGLLGFNTKLEDGTVETANNVYPGYIEAGGMYMGQTTGVPARYLGDAVYFKAYAKLSDGSYVYSGMVGYNAAVYAKSILKNSSNDYMKRLVVAMINYGAEAQAYFCGKEGVEFTPMNNFLTEEQQAMISAYDASMVADLIAVDSNKVGMFTYNTGDFAKRTNSVSFDGAFAINYYFTAKGTPDNGMKFYYWNTADYLAADVLTPENATGSMDMVAGSGNQYWGQVSGIAAKEVDQTYFVAGVYELDGVTYTTGILAYSLGKYCAKLAAGTTDQQALSAATAVYGYYAKEYFANI